MLQIKIKPKKGKITFDYALFHAISTPFKTMQSIISFEIGNHILNITVLTIRLIVGLQTKSRFFYCISKGICLCTMLHPVKIGIGGGELNIKLSVHTILGELRVAFVLLSLLHNIATNIWLILLKCKLSN